MIRQHTLLPQAAQLAAGFFEHRKRDIHPPLVAGDGLEQHCLGCDARDGGSS